MSKYRAREAPVEGTSVSETHHGYWADHVRHEDNRRVQWFEHYGHFYEKNLSGLHREYESNPISGYVPPVESLKYITDGSVSESEPVAYLNECIRRSKLQGVPPDGKNGVRCQMPCGSRPWCFPYPGTGKEYLTGPCIHQHRYTRGSIPLPEAQITSPHHRMSNIQEEHHRDGTQGTRDGLYTRNGYVFPSHNVCSGQYPGGFAYEEDRLMPSRSRRELLKTCAPCCNIEIHMQPTARDCRDTILKSCERKGTPLAIHAPYPLIARKHGPVGNDHRLCKWSKN